MNSAATGRRFDLEALEARVLLSADFLGSEAAPAAASPHAAQNDLPQERIAFTGPQQDSQAADAASLVWAPAEVHLFAGLGEKAGDAAKPVEQDPAISVHLAPAPAQAVAPADVSQIEQILSLGQDEQKAVAAVAAPVGATAESGPVVQASLSTSTVSAAEGGSSGPLKEQSASLYTANGPPAGALPPTANSSLNNQLVEPDNENSALGDLGEQVVFIDSTIQDHDILANGVVPGTEVLVLDAGRAAVEQIAGTLTGSGAASAMGVQCETAAGDSNHEQSSFQGINDSTCAYHPAAQVQDIFDGVDQDSPVTPQGPETVANLHDAGANAAAAAKMSAAARHAQDQASPAEEPGNVCSDLSNITGAALSGASIGTLASSVSSNFDYRDAIDQLTDSLHTANGPPNIQPSPEVAEAVLDQAPLRDGALAEADATGGSVLLTGWGDNLFGQSSPPSGLMGVIAIAAGSSHSLAIKRDGTIFGWGLDWSGESSPPVGLSGVIAVAANGQSLALKSDGTVVGWGINNFGQAIPPQGLNGVIGIAAGGSHNLALKSDGTVVGWGSDSWRQASPPVGLSGVTAIAAGTHHSLALKSDGTVVGWGNDSSGATTPPPGLSGVVAIAAKADYSLALRSDGTVVGWGSSPRGQANPPVGLKGVIAIAAAYDYSLALKSDGTVVGWGWDAQLGSHPPVGLTDVTAIAAGNNHSLALKRDGTVVGWGNGGPSPPAIDAGAGFIAIAAGAYHSLAAKSDGTVIGWGYNANGQASPPAGLTGVTALAAGGAHSLALKSDGTVVGWGDSSLGQTNVPPGLSGVIAIAAGARHSLALKSNGTVVGWGYNNWGQAAPPSSLSSVIAIAAGGAHSVALKSDGTVFVWGWTPPLESGVPRGLNQVVGIATGEHHYLALKMDGTVVAWGEFEYRTVPASASTGVVAIAAGGRGSLALKNDGTVVDFDGGSAISWKLTGVTAISVGGPAEYEFNGGWVNMLALHRANNPPTLDAIPDALVIEDSDWQSVNLSGITPGSTDKNKNIQITAVSSDTAIVSDLVVVYASPNVMGTLRFRPAPNVNGTVTITVMARDDGGTAYGGVDSFTRTFTITVSSVNDVPTLDTVTDVTVVEDADLQNVTLMGISAGLGDRNQILTVTATSSNSSVVPNPTVDYLNPNGTGSLRLRPVPDAVGTVRITVTVTDNGGTDKGGVDTYSRSFTVTVLPVNHAPVFMKGADWEVSEGSGPWTSTGWATGIGPGPPDESDQVLDFLVAADQPSLFSEQPSVAANGTLTFTPATDAFGTAIVTIRLHDSGGTANGGVDTSTPQTFTITIQPLNDPPTLSVVANQTINEDSDWVAVPLSGISAGPPNESGQVPTLSATSSDSRIIPSPTSFDPIGADGTSKLWFKPVADANGVVTITVTVQDDDRAGGAALQVSRQFTVMVSPVNDAPNLSAISEGRLLFAFW